MTTPAGTTTPATPVAGRDSAATDFRLYLISQSASVFGSTMTGAALSIIAVATLHAGPQEVSFIIAAGLLPTLLIGPFAGALLDRVTRPRSLLITTDLFAAVSVGGCFAAAVTGHLGPWGLAALGLALGCAQIVVQGLYFSHLRTLGVPDVAAARGRLQASEMGSRSVAGAVAGVVVGTLGAATLFLVDAITYLASAVSLTQLRSPDHREIAVTTDRSLRREFGDGIRVIAGHRTIRAFTVFLVLSGAGSAAVVALRANFVLDELHVPVALFTVPSIAATVLGAAGALFATRLVARAGGARRALAASMLGACSTGLFLVLAAGPVPLVLVLLCAGTALPMFFGAVGNLALVALISDDLGDAYFARVTTLLTSLGTAASLGGTVLGGALSGIVGVRAAIGASVAISTVAALWLVASTRPARTVQRDTHDLVPDGNLNPDRSVSGIDLVGEAA